MGFKLGVPAPEADGLPMGCPTSIVEYLKSKIQTHPKAGIFGVCYSHGSPIQKANIFQVSRRLRCFWTFWDWYSDYSLNTCPKMSDLCHGKVP